MSHFAEPLHWGCCQWLILGGWDVCLTVRKSFQMASCLRHRGIEDQATCWKQSTLLQKKFVMRSTPWETMLHLVLKIYHRYVWSAARKYWAFQAMRGALPIGYVPNACTGSLWYLTGLLLQNGVIQDLQYGFLLKRSIDTNLLSCLNDWTQHHGSGLTVDADYQMLEKAFDRVPFRHLFYKLDHEWEEGCYTGWLIFL